MNEIPIKGRRTIQPGFGKRIGNRWLFALEFEIHGAPPANWKEWWGSLWLWVEGHLVGRPYESEMVQTALDSLQEAASEDRTRVSAVLSTYSAKEALDDVVWARYGEGGPPNGTLPLANEGDLFSLEILPRRTGPFFDGWEAILLEKGATEHFVYRQEGAIVTEAVWPQGTFSDVVGEARVEYEKLARSVLKETTGIS
jgi:hypothetical protein